MSKCLASAAVGVALWCVSATASAMPIEMENTEVRDFARWYATQVGMDLVVDPAVTGTLSVYAENVPDEDLRQFGEGVFRAHGYEILHGNPPLLVPMTNAPASPGQGPGFAGQVDVSVVEQSSAVFPLNNVRADDVAALVQSFMTRTTAAGSGGSVQVIHASNSLLVTGADERIEDLHSLIRQFDVPHPQVLIRAVIWETVAGDSLDLGVAFGTPGPSSAAGGFNTRNLSGTLSTLGGSFGIFDGNTLALAVQAIQRDNTAKILSTPQVLALSGRPGRISVGQNVPVITGRVTGAGADLESPFQTIERKDVGVTLAVTPVVLGSGSIVMDVQTTADSLTDSMQAADIITNQRSIHTTVRLRSGQTLLLGGLDSENQTESVSSVPVLGDIPGLGALFRNTSTSTEHRKLYVLLQATEVTRHGS